MRFLSPLFLLILFYACTPSPTTPDAMSGEEILQKSQMMHDPQQVWGDLTYRVKIVEPRLQNPGRLSIVQMNNSNGAFELMRSRDEYFSKHVVDAEGKATVYFDDQLEFPDSLVNKYRLDPARNNSYRNFYQVLLGLPMSLDERWVAKIGSVETKRFNDFACYKIEIELKEAMFSKHWFIYIDQASFKYRGMELVFPEDASKGETLYFSGEIDIKGVKIPRTRHWHEYSGGSYSGSDIILEQLDEN